MYRVTLLRICKFFVDLAKFFLPVFIFLVKFLFFLPAAFVLFLIIVFF